MPQLARTDKANDVGVGGTSLVPGNGNNQGQKIVCKERLSVPHAAKNPDILRECKRKVGKLKWSCSRSNFTVEMRGSIKSDDFESRLAGFGVNEKNFREVLATRTIRKTLEISDVMLQIFHMAIRTNPEWVKHAVAEALANTSTERYNLCKKFMAR